MTLSTEEYRIYCALFEKAEQVLKRVETANTGFSIPGTNELRYAGSHLCTALVTENEEEARSNLFEGKNHLRRVVYDSLMVGISQFIRVIDGIQEEFNKKYVAIPEVIHNYPEKLARAKRIHSEIGRLSRDQILNEDQLEITQADFDFLDELVQLLTTNEDALTVIANRHSRRTRLAVVAIFVALITPLGVFLLS